MNKFIKRIAIGSVLCLGITGTSVQSANAAGAPMVVNYTGNLPNGLKTEANGTINSINDLNSDDFKVKLTTKSEDDPKELNKFLLDGALQYHSNSSFKLLSGSPVSSTGTEYKFDPKDQSAALPSVLVTNIGKTKTGQGIDAVWSITHINKPNGEESNNDSKSQASDSNVSDVVKESSTKDSKDTAQSVLSDSKDGTSQGKETADDKANGSSLKDVTKADKQATAKTVSEATSSSDDAALNKKDDSSQSSEKASEVKPKKNYYKMRVGDDGALSIHMKEMGGIDYTIQFYKAGTRTPIDLLIYPVVNDVDYSQVFGMPGANLLGYGSNISTPDGNTLVANSMGADGINDFPLGGGLYQTFGNQLNVHYNSKGVDGVHKNDNAFDLLGSFGMIKNITVGKPDFGPVKIPKASWQSNKENYQAGQKAELTFNQPINTIDKDINHRYNGWQTTFTVPKEFQNPQFKVVDDDGNTVPVTQKSLGNQQYQLTVSKETIKKLPFKGETYHFKLNGQISEDISDQQKLHFNADTLIDGKRDHIAYDTQAIDHKAKLKVRFLRQDSTDAVAKTKTQEIPYGKPWKAEPIKAPAGYYLDKKSTTDVMQGDRADFKNKTVTYYYAPISKKIYVNYLDESGKKIDGMTMKGDYLDSYTTSAEDIDDDYSLDMKRIPKNASGVVGNRDETVNYYYRKNQGRWVDLGYGSQGLTRVDYHGHIRSNAVNYSDGQLITLINTAKGVDLEHDKSNEDAVESDDTSLSAGGHKTMQLGNQDSVTVDVSGPGTFDVTRKTPQYVIKTHVEKGNYTNETTVLQNGKTTEKQNVVANGVEGAIVSQKTEQVLDNQYRVVANTDMKDSAHKNTVAVDAPATDYETQLVGADDNNSDDEDASVDSDTADRKTSAAAKTEKKQSVNSTGLALFNLPIFKQFSLSVIHADDEPTVDSSQMQSDSTEKAADGAQSSSDNSNKSATDETDSDDDTIAASDAQFTNSTTGSASIPDTAAAFTDRSEGDVEDTATMQKYFAGTDHIQVYQGKKMLGQGQVKEGAALTVNLADPENSAQPQPTNKKDQAKAKQAEPTGQGVKVPFKATAGQHVDAKAPQLSVTPKGNHLTTKQTQPNGQSKTFSLGKLPATGFNQTWLWIAGGVALMLLLILIWLYRKARGGRHND